VRTFATRIALSAGPDAMDSVGMERDIEQIHELFENPDFRPDGLKVRAARSLINADERPIADLRRSTRRSSSAAPAYTSSGARAGTRTIPPTPSSISSPASSPSCRPGRGSTASSAISPCRSSRAASRTATSASSR
jgi:hypothetical protein